MTHKPRNLAVPIKIRNSFIFTLAVIHSDISTRCIPVDYDVGREIVWNIADLLAQLLAVFLEVVLGNELGTVLPLKNLIGQTFQFFQLVLLIGGERRLGVFEGVACIVEVRLPRLGFFRGVDGQ